MRRGLTQDEFREVCGEHALDWAPLPSRESTVTFLERCVAIGFVTTKVNGQGTVRYFATAALRGLFFED
jgi:hypothetical protein